MEKNRNVRIIAMIGILSMFIIYLIYHYATKDTSFNKYKVDKSKNIVYSIYGNGDTSVPEINIKGAGAVAKLLLPQLLPDDVKKLLVDRFGDIKINYKEIPKMDIEAYINKDKKIKLIMKI